MKIYGNSKSDGFALLLCLVGGLFVAGGVGLATLGAATMWAGLPVLCLLVAAMVVQLRKWDVMSEVAAPGDETAVVEGAAPVRLPSFPVAAASDNSAEPAAAAWSRSKVNDSGLPLPVEKPKSGIETNTAVA